MRKFVRDLIIDRDPLSRYYGRECIKAKVTSYESFKKLFLELNPDIKVIKQPTCEEVIAKNKEVKEGLLKELLV